MGDKKIGKDLFTKIGELEDTIVELKEKVELLQESRTYWKNIANSRFEHQTTISVQRSESGLL